MDGRKHNRDWLMNRIASCVGYSINPIGYKPNGSDSIFFVNEDSVATALEDTSNRITQKDGTKIIIRVASTKDGGGGGGGGSQQNTESEMEVLRQCLGRRYDMTLNKLDLSKLFADPGLQGFSPKVAQVQYMNKILDLIHALCPTLKSLDLSDNRIIRLENLANLAEKCPELEELNLSNNDIRFTGELHKISACKKIATLHFAGNPGQLQYSSDKVS